MPRTDSPYGYRLIYRKIWSNAKFNAVSLPEQRTYIGLVTLADDYGRLECEPYQLACLIWPGAEYAQHQKDIGQYLQKLSSVGLILPYRHNDCIYLFLPGFEHHQHLTRQRKSFLPDHCEDGSKSLSADDVDKIGQLGTGFANCDATKHNTTKQNITKLGAASVDAATVLRDIDDHYVQVPSSELARKYVKDCYASATQLKAGQAPSPKKHLELAQELVAIYQGERAYNRTPIKPPSDKDWAYSLKQTIKTCTLPPFTDRPPYHSCLRKILLSCQDGRSRQHRIPDSTRELLDAGKHDPNKVPVIDPNWKPEDDNVGGF